MSEKKIKARLQQKHDTSANWALATNFKPKAGELIIYDDLKKMKVITSFRDFLIKNNIRELLCDSQMAFRIEDHFVGFLSYGNYE